jgi:predicted neutral ceramidase superfamily lipid hydrolase
LEYRKLSDTEIDYLYSFCVKHYVRDYDVQVELVDHLTNAIENLWKQIPDLTFEQALEMVYKTFGYKGFASIVSEKTIAIQKQHNKAKSKIFWSFFTWPKAAFSFMIAAIIVLLPKYFSPHQLKALIAFVLIVAMFLQAYFTIQFHRNNRKQKKQLLLTANIAYTSDGLTFMYIFFPYHNVFDNVTFGIINFYALSALLYVICISFYISINYGKSVLAKAEKDYPLAFV